MLRGFVNACRHRGHELLPCGASTAKRSVVCPYHAWTYKLDGSMRNAPHMDEVEGFDPGDYGLQTLPVHEWHGWVFVASSGGGRAVRGAHRRARADHRAVRAGEPRGGRDPRVHDRGQLEGHRRELPGVLPLLDDPPRAVRGEPAGERREPRPARRLGRRRDGPAGQRADDVARRQEPRREHRGPLADRAADRDVHRGLPEPAGQPAPRLRHDPPAHAARAEPDVRRVLLGVPEVGRSPSPASTRRTRSTSGT